MSTFWIVVLVLVMLALVPFILRGLAMLVGLLIAAGAMVVGLIAAAGIGIYGGYVLLSEFFKRWRDNIRR